ncbi:MAG: 4Fe-4S binding protein [Candidatus Aminicenantes bacterium]|nr:4Fe-4S binding protein [Candidatus Aminicenantes bacterium]MCK5004258.1 4Fe-4S binding protein [Candidatus Aminicenantes bacterium]
MGMKYLKNVAQLELDSDKCTGCGMCVEVCPHAVFIIENKKAIITDRDLCMECGACQINCPFNALNVRKGVGCANAVIKGKLKGTEPTCGCSDSPSCC